ncbi:MAG: DUF58 domain-containing protein [Paracoccaceae bacterium]
MPSDGPAASTEERAATELGLDELLAMRPARVTGPFARGRRGPDGERAGRGHAVSLQFEGIAPYAPGDDVRWIDWRATARTGETQIRRFAAESHRAHVILLDLHPALHFGMRGRYLAKTAALVAARLAWEADALHEPVGLIATGVEPAPVRRGRRAASDVLGRIRDAYHVSRTTAPPPLAERLAEASRRLGAGDELHLVGDLEDEAAATSEAARGLTARLAATVWLVEDPAMAAPVAPGRFPLRLADGARRVVSIGRRAAAQAPETAERLRVERRRRLRDAGWTVRAALDLAPSASTPRP